MRRPHCRAASWAGPWMAAAETTCSVPSVQIKSCQRFENLVDSAPIHHPFQCRSPSLPLTRILLQTWPQHPLLTLVLTLPGPEILRETYLPKLNIASYELGAILPCAH